VIVLWQGREAPAHGSARRSHPDATDCNTVQHQKNWRREAGLLLLVSKAVIAVVWMAVWEVVAARLVAGTAIRSSQATSLNQMLLCNI
jgi:hypothetical protein